MSKKQIFLIDRPEIVKTIDQIIEFYQTVVCEIAIETANCGDIIRSQQQLAQAMQDTKICLTMSETVGYKICAIDIVLIENKKDEAIIQLTQLISDFKEAGLTEKVLILKQNFF